MKEKYGICWIQKEKHITSWIWNGFPHHTKHTHKNVHLHPIFDVAIHTLVYINTDIYLCVYLFIYSKCVYFNITILPTKFVLSSISVGHVLVAIFTYLLFILTCSCSLGRCVSHQSPSHFFSATLPNTLAKIALNICCCCWCCCCYCCWKISPQFVYRCIWAHK